MIHPHPYYTRSDLKLRGRWERWAHRPEQQADAPPHSLPSPAPSRDVGKPLERQVAKLRHTSPDNQARTMELYVSIHKGEGAWNIIFFWWPSLKVSRAHVENSFQRVYLMKDWHEATVSMTNQQRPALSCWRIVVHSPTWHLHPHIHGIFSIK